MRLNEKIKRTIILVTALSTIFAMTIASNAAHSIADSFTCGGYYVGYNASMTSNKVTAVTGFTKTLTGQKTSTTINTIIKINNGTGATSAGTPKNINGDKTASASYTCPNGYTILSASTRHTAQVNGSTKTAHGTLN